MAGAVLVTGASSGIGRATVHALARHGFHVEAGVRAAETGRKLADELPGRVTPRVFDVRDDDAVARMGRDLAASLGAEGLAGVVNAAGIAALAPVEIAPLDDFREVFDVNVLGAIRVVRATAPALRRGRGRVVNVGSLMGRWAPPLFAPYSASKFALEAVTQALRVELAPWRIPVSMIEAGAVRTPLWDRTEERGDALLSRAPSSLVDRYAPVVAHMRRDLARRGARGVEPERVGRVVLRALVARRPRHRYRVGWDARLHDLGRWMIPEPAWTHLVRWRLGLHRTPEPVGPTRLPTDRGAAPPPR